MVPEPTRQVAQGGATQGGAAQAGGPGARKRQGSQGPQLLPQQGIQSLLQYSYHIAVIGCFLKRFL